MRRFRQELSKEESLEILKNGKVAVIAVAEDDGYPYTVPLNYVYADGFIYFHSALQGHKIDALRRNPKCSVCVIERDEVVPERFTSFYRSVIAFGTAEFITSPEEKMAPLRLLCDKYSPGIDPEAEISKGLNSLLIIRIKLESITGKEAIELTRRRNQQ